MTIRVRAAGLLAATLLVFALSLSRDGGSVWRLPDEPRVSDPAVYEQILTRLRNGEPYYDVIGQELRAHHYATVEVFNWRTPLVWRSLAPLPGPVRRGALVILAMVATLAAIVVAARVSPVAMVTAMVVGLGCGLMMTAPASVPMGEAWAGGFMGLSVCAYVSGRRRLGLAAGVIAIFLRELVAPYTLVCVGIAMKNRRWREVAAWLVAGAAYFVYYGFHLMQIWAHRLPTDESGTGSWIAFGGLTFVLSTVQWNAALLLTPWFTVAAALALLVAGVLSPKTPMHLRWAAGVYLLMFLVVGQAFDRYWGLVTWPTWVLACGYGAHAVVAAVGELVSPNPASVGDQTGLWS